MKKSNLDVDVDVEKKANLYHMFYSAVVVSTTSTSFSSIHI